MLGAQIAVRVISYPYPLTVPEMLTTAGCGSSGYETTIGVGSRLVPSSETSRFFKPLLPFIH